MPSANLLLLHTKNHCLGCFWWFGVTAFLCCLGKICDACHKISATEFFVAYPTVPLSARGFPAHPQPVKWFSSYIEHSNLTSCNGLTRHWYLAMPATCPATCCAARSKDLCNSLLGLVLLVWNTEVRRYKTSALAVLPAGSHPFVRKHMGIHTVLVEQHKPWPPCTRLGRSWSLAQLTSSGHG